MAQKRTSFTPEQEKVMRDFRADGLIGTGPDFHDKIQLAMQATGMTRDIVCAKVLNMKRTKTHKDRDPLSVGSSGHNGYHLFCSKMGKVHDVAAIRQRIWGEMWRKLTSQEMEEYNKEAARRKKRPASELNEDEKKKVVKKHAKSIKDSFAVLHELEVNGMCILNKDSHTFSCSSGTGGKVLETHIDKIEMGLLTSLGKPQTVEMERLELKRKLRQKVKDLYTAFRGKPSTFPYRQYNRNEVDFVLHGLPAGTIKDISTLGIQVLRSAVQAEIVIEEKEKSSTGDDNTSGKKTSSTASATHQSRPTVHTVSATETNENLPPTTASTNLDEGCNETTATFVYDGSVLGIIPISATSAEEEDMNEVECAGGIVPAKTAMERLQALVAPKKKTTGKDKKEKKKTALSPNITRYFSGSSSPTSDSTD